MNVWTKDPHGGPYRVSSGPAAARGYDALEENPDGSVKASPDIGYEKPQVGLTSNFVGNHMTQGAIDLVQGGLARKDLAYERAKLVNYQQTYHPPKLISRGEARTDIVARQKVSEISKYRWWNAGPHLVVEAATELAEGAVATSEFTDSSFAVTVRGEAGAVARSLAVPRLFKSVVPEGCTCEVRAKAGAATAVVVKLLKADAGCEWPILTAARPEAAALPSTEDRTGPDLALLRKAIRRQRREKKPGDGLLYADLALLRTEDTSPSEGAICDGGGGSSEDDEEGDAVAVASMEEAQTKVEAGDYDGALKLCTEALQCVSDVGARARCHLQRSHCWQQLGDLKSAVKDAEACLGLQVSGGMEEDALLALARLHESTEDHDRALSALDRLSRLAPSHPNLSTLRSRLRRAGIMETAIRDKEREERAKTRASDLLPSVPRRMNSKFENRGKSGAVF